MNINHSFMNGRLDVNPGRLLQDIRLFYRALVVRLIDTNQIATWRLNENRYNT